METGHTKPYIIHNLKYFLHKFVGVIFFLSFKGSLYLKMYPNLVKEVPVFRQYIVVFFPIFHSGSVFSLWCGLWHLKSKLSPFQLLCASISIPPATILVPTAENWGWGIDRGVWGTCWITFLHILTSNPETDSTAVNQKSLPPESNNIQKTGIYAHVRDWLQLVRLSRLSDFRAISSITKSFCLCGPPWAGTQKSHGSSKDLAKYTHLHIYIYEQAHTHTHKKKGYNACNFLLYWLNWFFKTG